MQDQGLDNKLYRALPEGVSINLQPAGLAVRTSAYLVDLLIRTLVLGLLGIALSLMGDAGIGLFLVSYFIITWGYYIFFESRNGQTPGKKRYKLRVVQDNGLPAHFSHIVTRSLLRTADSFPFAYVVGIITLLCSKEFKRVGDWAAGTLVVYDEVQIIPPINDGGQAKSPPFTLSTIEQLAIVDFAQRSESLSEARQVELASLLSPLLKEQQSPNEELKSYARYYSGQETSGQEAQTGSKA
ncbi:RDD family protein [Saccharobesus litoralis]|uniref:RDD family protein n=1 Tax=Saccharobesus litoralis TaxID=2172099 RepID=A0A2S0VVY0_9ALTE|nr:RDD family protein [Saccharobesus litoralis]AWB68371.1 RDD family protein [Saccharobesus litoralis]